MNPTSLAGAFVITFSLLSYGIGSISLQRFKVVSSHVLVFLTIGVVLDVVAATLMIIGSAHTPFSLHGFIGLSAIAVMIADVILLWRVFNKYGSDTTVPKPLLLYSKLAYLWWIIAYLTGSVLVIWR
ncbi:MAG TPA: hypothetical protein VJ919_08160 [Tangfeifania sp.]|nr:hypothetical protein [Tangfeifania sp.]